MDTKQAVGLKLGVTLDRRADRIKQSRFRRDLFLVEKNPISALADVARPLFA
ncbi:MAG: hypothetical protein GY938_05610 [Ketobacter sp.]|nr:hypothetical protein [Ketobacter sp.]